MLSRGVILPPDDFFRQSVDAVRKAGGVFIADEVQTGFGRLGSSFWAFEHGDHGIVPDIMTIGKPFGNGMSLGAVVMTRVIADHFDSMGVEYFNTFGGSPVSAAAGLAVMDVLEDEKLQEHALGIGKYLKDSFLRLQQKEIRWLSMSMSMSMTMIPAGQQAQNVCIGDIRGSGLFLGIELIRDRETKEPAAIETSFICTILKQKYSILTSIDGLHENVLVIKPPMVFSTKDVDTLVDAMALELERITTVDLAGVTHTPT